MVVDIAVVRWKSAVAVGYVNMLGWKTGISGLVSILVRLLMVIRGTFGIGAGWIGRRVARFTTAVLTAVVVGLLVGVCPYCLILV